jgi:hypothetical protein
MGTALIMKPVSFGIVYVEQCDCGQMEPHGHPVQRFHIYPKPESNVYRAGPVSFEAWNDRLVIVEDPFKSGYECDRCNQTGKLLCPDCNGLGTSGVVMGAKCKVCRGDGSITCPDCNGKGELIVIPDAAKRRPTTGVIVSIGPKIKNLRKHDAVLYHDFVGCSFDLTGAGEDGIERAVTIRIIREDDVLVKVHGHMELSRMRKKNLDQPL